MTDGHWKIHEGYAAISAWAMDFERALKKKSFIHKMLLRLVLGKYAFRELYGLRQALKREGYCGKYMDYDLERMKYHKDKIPLIWWRDE